MPLSDPRSSASSWILQARITDLATADTAYFASPEAGYIKEVHIVIEGTKSGTDTITVTTDLGALPTFTDIDTAAGSVTSQEYSKTEANNFVPANAGFSIATDGLGTGPSAANVVVVMENY